MAAHNQQSAIRLAGETYDLVYSMRMNDHDLLGRESRLPSRRRRPVPWWPFALAVMIVVAVLAAWRWAAQPRYEWRLVDVVAPAGILAATGDLQVGAVQRGGFLRTGEQSEIELQLGEQLRLRLLGGSAIELPPPPPRWYSGEILLTVREGEVYGTTGASALDLPLRVVTSDAEVEILGTTFAVLQATSFTTICLWQGSVRAASRVEGSTHSVPLAAESKILFYPDGTVSESLPLESAERSRLRMMADAGVPPAIGGQK